MINVLITAVGGDIGQGVLKALKLSPYDLSIVGTDVDTHAPGLFLCDRGYIVPATCKQEDEYINKIIQLCQKENIDIVFSCHEAEQYVIASNIDKFKSETNTFFVVQPLEVLSITADKSKVYPYLSKNNIRVPETQYTKEGIKELINKYSFPIVLKSAQGSGSRHFHLAENEEEINKYWDDIPKPIAQEYITNDKNEEYTVGIFLDNNSKSLGAITMLRKMRFGLTSHAIIDEYPDVTELAVLAAQTVGAIGPCNVQLRRDRENKACIIEINARISSTVAFRAKLGFNEVEASVDYFLKNKQPDLVYKKGVVMKIWDELIIPTEQYRALEENGNVDNEEY